MPCRFVHCLGTALLENQSALPFYPIDIPRNELLDNLDKSFVDINGDAFTPDVSQFPKVTPLFSPRVGVNYDVNGEKKTHHFFCFE